MPDPLNVVVDISHHNGNVNLAKAKEDGILGVIQKATQGQTFKDPTYQRNRQKAKDAGLLWGPYHFATGSDQPATEGRTAIALLRKPRNTAKCLPTPSLHFCYPGG